MKTCQARSILAVSIFAGLALSGVAHAIPLPDTTSPCSVGTNGTCFKITNGASNGTAIWGNGTSTTSSYGIFGSGFEGVRGLGIGNGGIGVHGFASNSGGNGSYGVKGESSSTSFGAGVEGVSTAFSGGIGVLGIATQANGIAVWARGAVNSSSTALYASTQPDPFSIPTGYAVYANGLAGGTFAWQGPSDVRLKKDIKDVGYGLQEILKLRPVTFKWKDREDGNQLGFIAQEVQAILPEIVHKDSAGMLSLGYTDFIPVMAKAIQEQQKVIQRLERERAPVMTSSFSGGLGGGLALGLLPLGTIAALRRRRKPQA